MSTVTNPATGVQTQAVALADQFGNPLSAAASSVPVADTSLFTVETTTLLGSSATFTGAMHDATAYNWFGAKANVSGGQAGTLFVDESSAAAAANIYQVATQA